MGSPISPKPPFLSLTKPSHNDCNGKDQSNSKTSQIHIEKRLRSQLGPTESELGLMDVCTLLPSETNTLPYTKAALSTKDSECLGKTLELSNENLSSWITSTPEVTQTDSIQLTVPTDGDPQFLKYASNSEERLQSDQRTHQVLELHTSL